MIDSKINGDSHGKNIRFRASKRNPALMSENGEDDIYATEFTFKRQINTGDKYDRVYK